VSLYKYLKTYVTCSGKRRLLSKKLVLYICYCSW